MGMQPWEEQIEQGKDLVRLHNQIKDIAGALNTCEQGEALIEVARNAHKAEQQLAQFLRLVEEEDLTTAYRKVFGLS